MRRKRNSDGILYILSSMIGIVVFIALYGVDVLNPFYDDWLLGKRHLTQHYLGWCFYRGVGRISQIVCKTNRKSPVTTSIKTPA